MITSHNREPLSKTEKTREVFKRCREKLVTERRVGLRMELKILPKVHPVPRSPKVLLELHTHDLHTHGGSLLLVSTWCSDGFHLASGIHLPTKNPTSITQGLLSKQQRGQKEQDPAGKAQAAQQETVRSNKSTAHVSPCSR